MFNFKLPNINVGHMLGQANPMSMIGNAFHMSPMTNALGMLQRHPQDPQMQNQLDQYGMRQMIGQHMPQQQPQMPTQMHPNPMVNMSGMNMSQMLGVHPQEQPGMNMSQMSGVNPQEQNVSPPIMNPSMNANNGMAPMGTPIGRGGLPTHAAQSGFAGALNAQRPMSTFAGPDQLKMQKMRNLSSKFGL